MLFRPLSCHNYVVSVRTTIDIPEDLYEALRRRAGSARTSMRSLVIGAIERKFGGRRRSFGYFVGCPPGQRGRAKESPDPRGRRVPISNKDSC